MKILALLAGGRGERLRPFTETRPKPLIPILGEPLLCRHLRLARSRTYDKVLVLASHMIEQIVETARRCDERAEIVDQKGELGTGDAIRKVMEQGGPGEYTIIYADTFMHKDSYERLLRSPSPAVLAARVERPWEYGAIEARDGLLVRVREKSQEARPGSPVFAGAVKLSYDHIEAFRRIALSERGEYEATDALNLIASAEDVRVVESDGFWLDVGRPWDILLANALALELEMEGSVKGEVHPSVALEGKVYVAEGAKVGAYTVIEGPAYIGPGAVVGPHSHIRPRSVILSGAHVGAFSQVKASVIMEGAKAPHLNYVGDSVVGEHANLGAGTITANLRFDEREVIVNVKGKRVSSGLKKLGAFIGGYAKTGINVSIMPGVKIGSRALIWPGCVVTRDVEPGESYRCWAHSSFKA